MHGILRLSIFCLGLTASTGAGAGSFGGNRPRVDATDKHVQGIITSVDGAQITVSPMLGKTGKTAMGRVDGARTKLFVNGKPAHVGDLKVTYAARGELCLDDVWLVLNVDAR